MTLKQELQFLAGFYLGFALGLGFTLLGTLKP